MRQIRKLWIFVNICKYNPLNIMSLNVPLNIIESIVPRNVNRGFPLSNLPANAWKTAVWWLTHSYWILFRVQARKLSARRCGSSWASFRRAMARKKEKREKLDTLSRVERCRGCYGSQIAGNQRAHSRPDYSYTSPRESWLCVPIERKRERERERERWSSREPTSGRHIL